jgi:hypothetical protein
MPPATVMRTGPTGVSMVAVARSIGAGLRTVML